MADPDDTIDRAFANVGDVSVSHVCRECGKDDFEDGAEAARHGREEHGSRHVIRRA